MRVTRCTSGLFALTLATLGAGCAVSTPKPYDYYQYKQSRPASILVLPPLNASPDVRATYSVLSQVTMPLSEAGYYVLPVALVDETFRQNGLVNPAEMHDVGLVKLREIFGADAVLYIEVKQYGTSYAVVSSETRVTAAARLVDLRSGEVLWAGEATASSAEGRGSSGGGLVGMLVEALLSQVLENVMSQGHATAGITANRLLSAGRPNGILYGPRAPEYQKD